MWRYVLALALASGGVYGQEAARTGTLTGFITDPMGLPVGGVKVTVVNPQTRFTYSINAGIRWSYESPYQAKYRSGFEPNAVDPLTGRMGAITHPTGVLARQRWHNFDPPTGGAWTLRRSLVFRGSFGRSTIDLPANDTNVAFDEYCSTFKPTARFLTGGLTTASGRPPAMYISDDLKTTAYWHPRSFRTMPS